MKQEEQFNQELNSVDLNEGNSVLTKWWFWLIIVLVVALVIVAVVGWMVFKDREVNMSAIGQTQDEGVEARFILQEKKGETWGEGSETSIDVLMDTMGSNVVVGQAIIMFDPEALEYLGTDNSNSVLSMDAIDKYENGRIEIVRGIPGDSNPKDSDDGFTGVGNFTTLKFKVLRSGGSNIAFDNKESMIIIDDGKGTIMKSEFVNISK